MKSVPSYSSLIHLPRHEQEFWAEVADGQALTQRLRDRHDVDVDVQEHHAHRCTKTECSPAQAETFSISYTFSRLYVDWPDKPPEEDKYIMIRVFFNDAFSEAERNALVPAFRKFINVILTQAYNERMNSVSGFTYPRPNDLEVPWGGTFPNTWSEALKQWRLFAELAGYLPPQRPDYMSGRPRYQPIYVERFSEDTTTWGRAEINHYALSYVFRISLNAHIINNVSTDVADWAGVIAHELMHNLGWDHDADTTDRKEFIYRVQEAIHDL